MDRTQIYLDSTNKEKLKKIAEETGKTMAELIREAVDQYIANSQESSIKKVIESSGLWKDREDIADAAEYVNEMRNKWKSDSED